MRRYVLFITILVITLGLVTFKKFQSRYKPVYKTLEECTSATGSNCQFSSCDYKCENTEYGYFKGYIPVSFSKSSLLSISDTCLDLQENECIDNVYCEPKYEYPGPNKDTVGMPILNRYFIECIDRDLPKSELENEETKKGYCESGGGWWSKEFYECNCPTNYDSEFETYMPGVFLMHQGCIAFNKACESISGKYIETHGLPYCEVNDQILNLGQLKDELQ